MRSLFLLALSLFVIASPSAVLAQTQSSLDRNLIFAEGTAEVTGQNDSAGISLSVQSEAREMESAATDNAARTEAVLQAIKSLRIENLKVKTSDYRVTPQKDFKARPPVTKGYVVHNDIEITTEGFTPEKLADHVSKIIDTALMKGANTVRNIQFYVKDKHELEKQGLTLATKDAIVQAQILAGAAGVKLKRIVSISTRPIAAPVRAEMLRAATITAKDASMEPPIESGESKIRVRVSVVYEME